MAKKLNTQVALGFTLRFAIREKVWNESMDGEEEFAMEKGYMDHNSQVTAAFAKIVGLSTYDGRLSIWSPFLARFRICFLLSLAGFFLVC